MKIVVLDGYTLNPGDNPWHEVEKLGEFTCYDRTENNKIIERAKDADIILTNKTPLTAETINNLPNLKYISVLATGFNVVDAPYRSQEKYSCIQCTCSRHWLGGAIHICIIAGRMASLIIFGLKQK